MRKKAIFFDIDGTIYEPGKTDISNTVKEAIRSVQSMGHCCFIASGRPYHSLPEMVTSLEFDGYICANGTQIALKHNLLKERCINPDSADQILHLFHTMNMEYIFLTTGKTCSSPSHNRIFNYLKTFKVDLDAICTQYNWNNVRTTVLKMETLTSNQPEEIQRIKNFAESLGFFVEVKKDGYIEISDKTITKGTAMLEILKHFNIPQQDSICFGDGLNDLDMFHTAGYSIAMGNAVDEIKETANEVTLSVYEDGIAHSLQKLFGYSNH